MIGLSNKSYAILIGCLFLSCVFTHAQTDRTMNTDGDYNDAFNWSGADIADNIGENAVFLDGVNSLLRSTDDYTVANVNAGDNGFWRMQSGAQFQVGASGNEGVFEVGSDFEVLVRGNLTVFGDFDVGSNVDFQVFSNGTLTVGEPGNEGVFTALNNFELDVSGTLIIYGDLIVGDDAEISINSGGSLIVTGDVITQINTEILSRGNLTIGGDLDTQRGGLEFFSDSGGQTNISGNFLGRGNADLTFLFGTVTVGGRVEFVNSIDMTASNGGTLTIGTDLIMGNNTDFTWEAHTINIGGSITTGNNTDIDASSGNQLNVTGGANFGNNTDFTISGGADLSFGGDFKAGNNLDLDMSGGTTLSIDGLTEIGNESSVDISGGSSLTTGDDLILNNDTDISVSGGSAVDINGEVDCGGTSGDITLSVSGGSTFSAFACNCPALFCSEITSLPVELLYFNARAAGDLVFLNWSTQTEENNDFFTIERSKDGYDWTVIAEIPGAGFSNDMLDYEFTDMSPTTGWNYYRLKQTDYDGQFEYFDVVGVLLGASENGPQLYISRQGTEYVANVSIAASQATLVIYNANGLLIQRETLYGKDVINTTIPIRSTHTGLHIVKLMGSDQQLVRKALIH